jgi:hypothetical protein
MYVDLRLAGKFAGQKKKIDFHLDQKHNTQTRTYRPFYNHTPSFDARNARGAALRHGA